MNRISHCRYIDEAIGITREVRININAVDDPGETYHKIFHPDSSEIPVPGKFEIDGTEYAVAPAKPSTAPSNEKEVIYKVMNLRKVPSFRQLNTRTLPPGFTGEVEHQGQKIRLDLDDLTSSPVFLREIKETLEDGVVVKREPMDNTLIGVSTTYAKTQPQPATETMTHNISLTFSNEQWQSLKSTAAMIGIETDGEPDPEKLLHAVADGQTVILFGPDNDGMAADFLEWRATKAKKENDLDD